MRADVALGVGDDAALLQLPPGQQLVVTTDLLVSGVHFLPDADPAALGHKALAVNLSDLAAMGAEPAWFLLNLALPAADESWLTGFSTGLFELAQRYRVQLVGGDTSRAPKIVIAIEAHGFVPAGQALTRAGGETRRSHLCDRPVGRRRVGIAPSARSIETLRCRVAIMC